MKDSTSTEIFKNKISKWQSSDSGGKICQEYLYSTGYVNLLVISLFVAYKNTSSYFSEIHMLNIVHPGIHPRLRWSTCEKRFSLHVAGYLD